MTLEELNEYLIDKIKYPYSFTDSINETEDWISYDIDDYLIDNPKPIMGIANYLDVIFIVIKLDKVKLYGTISKDLLYYTNKENDYVKSQILRDIMSSIQKYEKELK